MRPIPEPATSAWHDPAKSTVRVGLVGTLPLLACGVQSVVSADPVLEWVDHVHGLRGAIALCESARPDVMLICSAGDPSWRICQTLTHLFRRLTVVALLGPESRTPEAAARARLHGARALVPVEADAARLVVAIRRTVETGSFVDPVFRNAAVPGVPVKEAGRPLSRRELEVLRLIAEGRTAVQIAARLAISAETVRSHVTHILRKLGARDRAHAVAKAYEFSLLPAEAAASLTPGHRAPSG
ncbi:response regulator transcription factor [Saccharothrix sp.]|uniref:response regulator transcription factor n=1 Tax=Saccharothrix sp. TaxID=1873460 RepID=UPI0028111CE6|nr:response regulator transcription factor [Saccharothrix sp.]